MGLVSWLEVCIGVISWLGRLQSLGSWVGRMHKRGFLYWKDEQVWFHCLGWAIIPQLEVPSCHAMTGTGRNVFTAHKPCGTPTNKSVRKVPNWQLQLGVFGHGCFTQTHQRIRSAAQASKQHKEHNAFAPRLKFPAVRIKPFKAAA